MEDKAKKTIKKYRVNRASVGINLMGACEPIILHNGLTQKKLKELSMNLNKIQNAEWLDIKNIIILKKLQITFKNYLINFHLV